MDTCVETIQQYTARLQYAPNLTGGDFSTPVQVRTSPYTLNIHRDVPESPCAYLSPEGSVGEPSPTQDEIRQRPKKRGQQCANISGGSNMIARYTSMQLQALITNHLDRPQSTRRYVLLGPPRKRRYLTSALFRHRVSPSRLAAPPQRSPRLDRRNPSPNSSSIDGFVVSPIRSDQVPAGKLCECAKNKSHPRGMKSKEVGGCRGRTRGSAAFRTSRLGRETPRQQGEEGEGERKLSSMRYSTAPAICMVTSWLMRRVAAFVVPSCATTSYGGRRASSHQHLCSLAATAQGRPVSAGLGRAVSGGKRRVAVAMSTGDGARWAPIPSVPNMQVK